MIRLVLFTWLALFSLNIYAQPPTEYHNMDGHYAFTPLSGWTVRANGTESFAYAPEDETMDAWSEKLAFSIADGEDIALEDAFDFYINVDFPSAYAKFKLSAQGNEQINDLPAKWATFTFSAHGTVANATSSDSTISATLQAVFYVIKKNNSLYLINGVTEKSLFPKFDPSFRSIIRTFRIPE